MGAAMGDYLDFLDSVYGGKATDQICKLVNLERDDLHKIGDAFAPAFLQSLLAARKPGGAGSQAATGLGNFWSSDLQKAMQDFMCRSARAAKSFAPASKEDNQAFPFNLFAEQSAQMDQLYQSFMTQVAQARLMEDVGKATGLDQGRLRKLFPLLTAYGLMPLMPLMPLTMDDPAGWVDYLGEMGRQNFKQASRDLDAMPNPMSAAFDGLLAGLYPAAEKEAPPPATESQGKMEQFKDASLTLQTNYVRGLNTLFEQYASGLEREGKREQNTPQTDLPDPKPEPDKG